MFEKLLSKISPPDAEQKIDYAFDFFYRFRRRVATAGMGLLAAWMAIHIIFGANGMMVFKNKKSDFQRLEGEIKSLQDENDVLTKQVKQLRSDPRAIEREAREQLRYAKPGEVIYLLPGTGDDQQAPPNAAAKK